MPRNFMQWGADFLAATLPEIAGETVTYQRFGGGGLGDAYTFELTAWVGQLRRDTNQPAEALNAAMSAGYMPFLLKVADFPERLKDKATDFPCPREGDWIIRTVDGRRFTYEAKPPPFGNESAWRFSDSSQTMFRVHTMLYRVEQIWP